LADNLVVTTGGTNSWTLSFGSASSITDNGGGFTLTMNGTGGTLILSGTNSYTGGTIVSAGKLIVTTADALPAGGNLAIGTDVSQLFGDSLQTAPAAGDMQAVPEPGALALLAVAVCGAAVFRCVQFRGNTQSPTDAAQPWPRNRTG
jgi:autotransporter-associated beta strand protein